MRDKTLIEELPVPINRTADQDDIECFKKALQLIARGRTDNGRPLAAERSRQIAREALIKRRMDWPRPGEARA
ncbi:hypothetical protein LCGC14_2427920 [marine sediment metagenome]|uniref:Uncharacterized protein n=1 Tax=marine sediment metagenome TaxID=412755 RepID=A0A0F9DZQ4_9ZZZZ